MTTFLIVLAVIFAIIAIAIVIIKSLIIKYVIKITISEIQQKAKKHPLTKDIDPEFFKEDLSISKIRNKLITTTGKKVIEKIKCEMAATNIENDIDKKDI